MQLRTDVFRAALDTVARPRWRSGKWRQGGGEPYLQEVLRTAAEQLTRDNVESSPRDAVSRALWAHENLLDGRFEIPKANAFLADVDEDELREMVSSFLWGSGPLPDRIDAFVPWARMDDRDGKKRIITSNACSFLLAVSAPKHAAFCKPSVYSAAAKALLEGGPLRATPHSARLVHCAELYKAALEILEAEYGLHDGNLFDVHSLFYNIAKPGDDAPPVWQRTPASNSLGLGERERKILVSLAGVDGVSVRFDDQLVRRLMLGLDVRPERRFALLTGLSGSGKTQLAWRFADAANGIPEGAENENRCFVSVQSDWTDPAPLLGYRDPLKGEYRNTEVLRFLEQAQDAWEQAPGDPERPGTYPGHHVLILDEMNLGRAEHYLAPLLSAWESRDHRVVLEDGRALHLTPNLYVLGTVNIDETTHTFSDKVLDRAFVVSFDDVDLHEWGARVREHGLPELPEARTQVDRLLPILTDLYEALRPAYRHFGYRVAEDTLRMCTRSAGPDPYFPHPLDIDEAVYAKILPKLRGQESESLLAVLRGARESCVRHGLERSQARLDEMHDALEADGMVTFWR